jgi:CobQ-like glutamine amidotransferase family enzyme
VVHDEDQRGPPAREVRHTCGGPQGPVIGQWFGDQARSNVPQTGIVDHCLSDRHRQVVIEVEVRIVEPDGASTTEGYFLQPFS